MNQKSHKEQPVSQAIKTVHPEASPISGVVPPKEHRWKPGQSGNPKGRPNAGAMVRDFYNEMAGKTTEELLKILRAPNVHAAKKRAAIEWLRAINPPDMADFESVVHGNSTLKELRENGIDTSHVKRLSRRSGKDGDAVSLELHDRDGKSVDRILDRTAGRPNQAVEVQQAIAKGVRIEFVTPEDMAKARHHNAPLID
jgi:Family of unknown function (DUF5681)